MERLIIGFCGGTGSGKTTLANRVIQAVGGDGVLVSMDCYYKDNRHLPFEERAKINYDHPDAFDTELLIAHLKDLKAGRSIMHPTYDYANHARGKEYIPLDSAKVIIVEGILLFENSELMDLLDIKIYVDTDADVRVLRRIVRDVNERGRNLEGVINQYLTTVKPMHEKFVEPYKRRADVIVPVGGRNNVAFNMIMNTIREKIAQ
ncbi:MAG: uridine kinase [Clostridia bacterium]|nr:uridine kinase [Clostridia bacterium]